MHLRSALLTTVVLFAGCGGRVSDTSEAGVVVETDSGEDKCSKTLPTPCDACWFWPASGTQSCECPETPLAKGTTIPCAASSTLVCYYLFPDSCEEWHCKYGTWQDNSAAKCP